MQEQLLVVSVGILAVGLKGRAVEGEVGYLLSDHILAEDFVPDWLVLVKNVLKVLLR